MKGRTVSLACLAATALGLPAQVGGQQRTAATDRQALVALEHEWLGAEHDSATLTRILGDDFVHPLASGDFVTKSQHIGWVTRHRPPKPLRHRFGRLDVRLYGDVGIVNGVVVASDTSGKELDRTVFTDVFAYRDNRWVAINAQETPVAAARR